MVNDILEFVHQYVTWGIFLAAFFAMFTLFRMQRQIKQMNRSLKTVTGSVKEYLQVVLDQDDVQNEPDRQALPKPREEDRCLREQAQDKPLSKRKHSQEEEQVFESVLQEYFS